MCGIIGILGAGEVAPRLIEALRRLEYRGYDSAGVAVLAQGGVERRRAPGKIRNLEAVLESAPLTGTAGIGHTRWATHGAPTETNAHPHKAGRVTLVHNGIIENFRPLREALQARGRVFHTETDSEVIAHLIDEGMDRDLSPADATGQALAQMRGAYALAVLFDGHPDLMIAARRGSPLVVGRGDGETFLGSDAIALAPFTQKVTYLEEGDLAILTRTGFSLRDAQGQSVSRPEHFAAASAAAEKGPYRHFMQKEMFEQPEALARTIAHYIDALRAEPAAPGLERVDFARLKRLHLIGCGTAHLAGRVAEYWFEALAGLAVKCDIASEFRYREPALGPDEAALFVSQSGETADTLAALRLCKARALETIAIVNVASSTMAREAASVAPTLAGPEIGVASTKAFTAQLAVLGALALHAARARGRIAGDAQGRLAQALLETPRLIGQALQSEPEIVRLAQDLARARDVLFLGRGPMYPLALEGALKLKEVSYIHAEGYAAGELKHGPIALVDEHTPVIVLAPHDALFEKTLSNLEEVAARGGKVVLISDAAGAAAAGKSAAAHILVPECDPFIAPILYAAPVQMLAYHVAAAKGTDVDQPRNLAKSVTVE